MGQAAEQALVIVGAGPAGLAPLFAAACAGELDTLLHRGVTILESAHTVGAGALGGYGISSDSAAEAFLDIIMRTQEPRLAALRSAPAAQALIALGKGAAPLQAVAAFLHVAGETMCAIVAGAQHGQVLTGVTAHTVRCLGPSCWQTSFRETVSGVEHTVRSHAVVLATGAHQPEDRLHTEPVAGITLLPRYQHKLLQSHAIMGVAGAERVRERLGHLPDPRVVIVGASTSAGAVATSLLDHTPGVTFGSGGVTILHRQPLRIFYETPEEARADGYTEFGPSDICRLTGRVFRLSGFRLESRALLLRARGIGGRDRETRLNLLRLSPKPDPDPGPNPNPDSDSDLNSQTNLEAQQLLEHADLIVTAIGYKPRLLPVEDAAGHAIPLLKPGRGQWAVVDQRCRVLTANGTPLDGLFAIGLAVGPAASEELGGETGFVGQVNSLWLWQHTLGMRIVQQALATADSLTSPPDDGPARLFNPDALHPRLPVTHGSATFLPALHANGRGVQ